MAAAALLVGCGEEGGRTVVVYSPHGKDLLEYFAHAFEQANPGVSVQWLDMGSQDCLDRIRGERANPQADIWWGAPSSMFRQGAREGLLAPYAPSWKGAVAGDTRDDSDRWYGTFLTPEVIMYNTDALAAGAAPKDWDDLLRPEWKGKIVIREPVASGTMRTIFCAMVQRERNRTGSLDSGFAWLRALDANTKSYCADQTQLYLKLSRQEATVTLWNMPDVLLQAEQHHYPFGYRVPASGTPVLTDGIALVKGAPHRDDAVAFYEFVTSAASCRAAAEHFYRIPARTDIDTASLPAWMRAPIPRLPVNWDELASVERDWMQRWTTDVRTTK